MRGPPQTPYPRRKPIRLDAALYAETAAVVSITICSLNRMSIFRDTDFTRACVALLETRVQALEVGLHAYCFMPDHLHLLINPSEDTSIVDFLRDFKGRSTRLAWQHGRQGKIWQDRFYDHLLRKDEDIETVVQYILDNPVRAGIVSDWSAYPFCGSRRHCR
jgi:REP-associated tyrosine transposase